MCHRRRWGIPQYWYMKDVPDHSPRFKTFVPVNGESFNSPRKRNSSKEALNEAARIALLHFDSRIGASAGDSSIESTKIASGSEKPLEIPLELAANGENATEAHRARKPTRISTPAGRHIIR